MILTNPAGQSTKVAGFIFVKQLVTVMESKPIYQHSEKDNKLITKWNSAAEAEATINVSASNIRRAAREKISAYGYIWSYTDLQCEKQSRCKLEDIRAAKALGMSVDEYYEAMGLEL